MGSTEYLRRCSHRRRDEEQRTLTRKPDSPPAGVDRREYSVVEVIREREG